MSRPVHALTVIAYLFVIAAAAGAEQELPPALMPDASQGVIHGRIAVGMWPAQGGELLDPGGFTVHLADDARLEEEQVYPAGIWFQPPPGSYKVWVEGDEGIAPSVSLLRYDGGPYRGHGLAATAEVGPAGRVALHPEVELGEGQSVRLLHLKASEAGRLTRGFLRAMTSAQDTVRMPAGDVVALLYDRRGDRFLAVSQPVPVERGETAHVHPRVEEKRQDLVVVLHRGRGVDSADDDDLALAVSTERHPQPDSPPEPREPDVLVRTWERVYALWYGLEGGAAILEAGSAYGYLEPARIPLWPGRVATYRGELRQHPFLDVRFDLPAEMELRRITVAAHRAATGEPVARDEVVPEPTARRGEEEPAVMLEGLPAAELTVLATLEGDPGWTLREQVDLSDGEGRELRFSPTAIVISGTVYLGDDPTPAEITIATDANQPRDRLRVAADENGEYRAVVYRPGRYPMKVTVPGLAEPFSPFAAPYIQEDTVLDIRVPRSGALVRVLDARSRAPVEGAWAIGTLRMEEGGGGSTNAFTDRDGVARYPPLPPGDLEVVVQSDGYLTSRPHETTVRAEELTELVVYLDPVGETATLVLHLPDGRPATGAEVRSQHLAWNEDPAWEGHADAQGRVEVPAGVAGTWLLVRHLEAGGWVQRWEPPAAGQEAVAWALPPAGGGLHLLTVTPDGAVARFQSVALRFPHAWVAGRALAWLTGRPHAATSANGAWHAANLPAVPLILVVGGHETMAHTLQGLPVQPAHRITPPWPAEPLQLIAVPPPPVEEPAEEDRGRQLE